MKILMPSLTIIVLFLLLLLYYCCIAGVLGGWCGFECHHQRGCRKAGGASQAWGACMEDGDGEGAGKLGWNYRG